MITAPITLTVYGIPRSKGSLKCIGGRNGRGHRLIEDHATTKPWRTTVAREARRIRQRAEQGQAIALDVTFTLPRPKIHFGTGRNSHLIKDSAPPFPVGHNTGDCDKLLRLLCDALEDAEVLHDDCQVSKISGTKLYVDTPGALSIPGIVARIYAVQAPTRAQEVADEPLLGL